MFLGNDIFVSDQKVKAKSNRNRNCIFLSPWESQGSHIGLFLLYFIYPSERHNFPYKLIPISMSYLKYFWSYQRKQYKCILLLGRLWRSLLVDLQWYVNQNIIAVGFLKITFLYNRESEKFTRWKSLRFFCHCFQIFENFFVQYFQNKTRT